MGPTVHVTPAIASSGEIPCKPGVDGAEGQLSPLGSRTEVEVVEELPRLGACEVGGQRQARLAAEPIGPLLSTEVQAQVGGAGVLPDDGVVDRLPRGPIPDDGGLPLVGHAGGGKRS